MAGAQPYSSAEDALLDGPTHQCNEVPSMHSIELSRGMGIVNKAKEYATIGPAAAGRVGELTGAKVLLFTCQYTTKRLLPPADAEDATVGVGRVRVALAVVSPAVGGAEVRTVAVTSPCGPG